MARAISFATLLTSISCATSPKIPDISKPLAAPQPVAQVNTLSIPLSATQFVYEIPRDASEGEVRIVAMGWTEIRTHSDETAKLPALHIRFIANKKSPSAATSDQDWSLDVRLQQIRFAGFDDAIRPLFVSASSGNLPYVRVSDDQQTAIELYYLLPAPLAIAAQRVPLPKFELRWSVLTSLQSVSETTQLVELYAESPTRLVYPNLSQQRKAKSRAPTDVSKASIREDQDQWWQYPFGEVPPAFSTIGIW